MTLSSSMAVDAVATIAIELPPGVVASALFTVT
jgi:hypothetical protein